MPITPYTTTPSRQNPTTFSADRDQRFIEENLRIVEMNALEVTVNNAEANAIAQAATAVAQASLAVASADVALAAANYKGPWSGCSGAANVPYCVSHLGQYWQLSSNLADVTAKTPGTNAEWLSLTAPIIVVAAKTSDATLSATELAGNYVITNTGAAGAVNLTLQPAIAGLGLKRVQNTVAQYLRLTADGTDKFRYGSTTGAAGGYVRNNVIGVGYGLVCLEDGYWDITDLVGTLKYDE
jgi:hypothetical protein